MPEDIEAGDVVQITNPDHDYYPALLVIGEVKDWGYKGYAFYLEARKHVVPVYMRVLLADVTRIGIARVKYDVEADG